MTRTSRLRVLAVVALLAVAPALAACGAGADANLAQPYLPTEAAETSKNGITVAQAFILGPDSGQTLPAGSAAPLYLTMVNGNPAADQLTGIATDPQAASSARASGPIPLPPQVLVKSANPTPQILIEGIREPLMGGESMRLTLQFQNAGAITMDVPVITRSREFATLQPAPSASPTAATESSPADNATGEGATGDAAAATSAEGDGATPAATAAGH